MVTIRTTKGDHTDDFTFTCRDTNGTVINISGATVKLYVGRFSESTLLVDGGSMTISGDGTTGIVTYQFADGVLTTNKYYDAQIEINWSGSGRKRLIPFTLHVMPELS